MNNVLDRSGGVTCPHCSDKNAEIVKVIPRDKQLMFEIDCRKCNHRSIKYVDKVDTP